MKKVAIDIDGILTIEIDGHDYINRTPNIAAIKLLNLLSILNVVEIYLYTSRYSCDEEATRKWLLDNNVICDKIVFQKEKYDFLIDDKAL